MAENETPENDGVKQPENRISVDRQAADADHKAEIVEDHKTTDPQVKHAVKPAVRKGKRGRHGVIKQQVPSTGHSWDGIEEYDNPLPRWWLWVFYACIVWAIIYIFAYPSIPLPNGPTQGFIGTTNRERVAAEIADFSERNAPIEAKLTEVALADIPADEDLMNYSRNAGGAIFRTWCSQCHGSGAGGAVGYPNLLDNDWLWGGSLEEIHTTLQHGIRDPQDPDTRYSEMPRFGVDGLLEKQQITEVAHYIVKMSGAEHDAELAAAGEQVYIDNCAACHMEDGSGDRMQGAPAFNDQIWLYTTDVTPNIDKITQIISDGPFGVMPSWSGTLSEAEIRAVATYVHSLGGGE